MHGDLGIQQAPTALALPVAKSAQQEFAERWKPWRSYATHYLWNA